ncbi:hypothetical protein ATW7_09788 [Alteromonadales bacterium TW-7]|nr:hypothetical protein ATW7_09788 [Alteromonadales bacterium TW-7]
MECDLSTDDKTSPYLHAASITGNGWSHYETGPVTADIVCESWNGFLDFFHDEMTLQQNHNYVFRGHASENWKLESTLKRKMSETGINKTEYNVLETFKKHCLGRRGHNPSSLSESEWWALGQHFGLDTPLLDWSDSPYVAAFFAFNSESTETDNVVVWLLSKNINNNSGVRELAPKQHLEFLTPYLDENARLINQRGLFIRTPNMECVNEWVNKLNADGTTHLGRILIPRSEKYLALDSLDKMNINDFTLFPDLLGSAKYANYVVNRKAKEV